MGNFYFFGPNLSKKGFWGGILKNLSPDLESAPPRYHVCQFSVRMVNFEFLGLNLRKLPNYVRYFGSNNVAEDLTEAEVGGRGWSWVEVEMSWVEVDGAGWRCVHGLVIPFKNILLVNPYY